MMTNFHTRWCSIFDTWRDERYSFKELSCTVHCLYCGDISDICRFSSANIL